MIRDSFSSKTSISNAIVDNKSPVSATQIKVFAPDQCIVLNNIAVKATINVSEAMMILNFSTPPESFGRIPARTAMKSKIPVTVPQVSNTFAPGQCIVLKSRPKSNIAKVMIEVILIVLFMAENELVSYRYPTLLFSIYCLTMTKLNVNMTYTNKFTFTPELKYFRYQLICGSKYLPVQSQ